jgi:hypothetical protein
MFLNATRLLQNGEIQVVPTETIKQEKMGSLQRAGVTI